MPTNKRKATKSGQKSKKSTKKASKGAQVGALDSLTVSQLLVGKSSIQRAPVASVVEHEANKLVIFKLVFTSILMMTLPFAVYFVGITAIPRLYPLMEENDITTVSAIASVCMILTIMVGYVIAALVEED